MKEEIYYLLNPHIALRSWRLVSHAYYIHGVRNAQKITAEEFSLLLQCNGQEPLEDSELLQSLVTRGLCAPCEQGATLNDWQKLKLYDNRYFPAIKWEITSRCNLNCLHCFNAVDNSFSVDEFSWEECVRLMDDARDCGVNAFTITGGEPMLHPHFMDILRGIHERGMVVDVLNTNLSFVTQAMLDEMKSFGCVPTIKTSFDAIGYHDWIRNKEGQEQAALDAIRLCIKNDFPVLVHTNVHKVNKAAILETAELLDTLGVKTMKILRTSESLRWQINSEKLCEGGACLSFQEFYDLMVEFSRGYAAKPHRMHIDIWQFLDIYPKAKQYSYRPVIYGEGEYRDSYSVCGSCRGVSCIAANGDIAPCLEMNNFNVAMGIHYGNAKKQGLKELFTEGAYVDRICTTVKQLVEHNEQCQNCRWWKLCAGGCRMFAVGFSRDALGIDKSKCVYFERGYPEKIDAALAGNGFVPIHAIPNAIKEDTRRLPDAVVNTLVNSWVKTEK